MPSKAPSRTDILLDARMIRNSGIGTYLRGLVGAYRNDDFFKTYSLGLTLPLGEKSDEDFPSRSFLTPVYSLWEQIEYPFHLKRCRLWHAPHYNIPFVKGGTRLVVTVHDLIHWVFGHAFYSPLQRGYARLFFERLVRQADRIITVSRHTRKDLIHFFNAPEDKIRVIHEGVEPFFFEPAGEAQRQSCLKKYRLPDRFFLYVGLLKPHKNVKRLIEAFRIVWDQKKIKTPLVIVGKKDKSYPKGHEVLGQLGSGEGIYYLPRVESRQELLSLYGSALALVHPSLYEGFGLTCLEAMAAGTPVIVSNAASLPEVVGEAAHFIDPHSTESIEQSLIELETNGDLREELALKGRVRARQFRWEEAARKTIEVYQELLR